MTVQPRGDRLIVRAHIPATALADARLPRLAGGTLDLTTIEQPLLVVAADTARNLDVQHGRVSLGSPQMTAHVGADRASVDVELTYGMDGNATDFSARLNAFQGTPLQPIRTTVTYLQPSGAPQIFSVIGPATRVRFDPTALDALQQFVARSLTSVLTIGDHVLVLACLLLPLRRAGVAARVLAVMMCGQALTIVACVLLPETGAAWAPWAAFIGASAVAMAAVQNIVSARLLWVGVLATVFGVLSGVAFGSEFALARQFAGAHQWIALATFLLVLMTAELWLGAVLWATRAWLGSRGVPERMLTVVASALIAHAAVHEVVDRSQIFGEVGPFDANRALLWLALAWAFIMLAIAAIEAIRRQGRNNGSDSLSNPLQA